MLYHISEYYNIDILNKSFIYHLFNELTSVGNMPMWYSV